MTGAELKRELLGMIARLQEVEPTSYGAPTVFWSARKKLQELKVQLDSGAAAYKEAMDFAIDSPDLAVLTDRMIQITSMEVIEAGKPRLLVDMDGTLAQFRRVDTLETLYEEGYFRNLPPLQNVVDAVKEILRNHPDTEVYIMSAVLSDSRYALKEKNEWLDQYLPEIDMDHRIFPPVGANKLDYVPDGVRSTDFLLDDYTHNLTLWEPPARGIKLLNGINHTNGTWKGSMLRYDKAPAELAQSIAEIMEGRYMQDFPPQYRQEMIEMDPRAVFTVYVGFPDAEGNLKGEWIHLPKKQEEMVRLMDQMSGNGTVQPVLRILKGNEKRGWDITPLEEQTSIYDLNTVAELMKKFMKPKKIKSFRESSGNWHLDHELTYMANSFVAGPSWRVIEDHTNDARYDQYNDDVLRETQTIKEVDPNGAVDIINACNADELEGWQWEKTFEEPGFFTKKVLKVIQKEKGRLEKENPEDAEKAIDLFAYKIALDRRDQIFEYYHKSHTVEGFVYTPSKEVIPSLAPEAAPVKNHEVSQKAMKGSKKETSPRVPKL